MKRNKRNAGMDCGMSADCEAHRKPNGWDAVCNKILLAGYAAGAPIVDIAAFLQRTPDAVRNRAFRIKAKKARQTGETAGEHKGETEMRTYGICINCGTSVPLQWSKDLTETEKNQLATLLCECRSRAVLVETSGSCRFCHQMDIITCMSDLTQAEKDEIATCGCSCTGARKYVEQKQQTENAKERIHQLFGEEAIDNGFQPIHREKTLELMGVIVGLMAQGEMHSVTIDMTATTKAKLSCSAKGKINVERIDTRKCKLEE